MTINMDTQSNSQSEALYDYLLRLGDSPLILGQRLCEWCGHAPALEEEIAIMNIGLDLIGQCRNWLELAAKTADNGQDADKLAFTRDAHQYRNLLIVEQPNGNFADTMARQYFYDAWHLFTLEALCNSNNRDIAEIAAKAVKEVRYHLRRSREWIIRLGDGTELSQQRMQQAIDDIWMYTGEMFEMDDIEKTLVQEGCAADQQQIKQRWLDEVAETLATATINHPDPDAYMQQGGKQGVHTEGLGFILAEMQFLQRAYPNATW
ncbi:1,2-phenylacetyl-CoA epoxidase subunit PaaC [Motiliproteus sp. MSK22-1]|uniref:1,2-phenylacetyl-CoA epoxidase subunit PaaC n=1 Tax=Motiliproteus sp. MSK22-1 TaxID=1897630 RepID=UPI001E561F42|nr:1,2-phenylacetyl-CoA epoxidase subunit PaaC [Motiliproteus sp. MSK22-1]